jgi:hypothetical protein
MKVMNDHQLDEQIYQFKKRKAVRFPELDLMERLEIEADRLQHTPLRVRLHDIMTAWPHSGRPKPAAH